MAMKKKSTSKSMAKPASKGMAKNGSLTPAQKKLPPFIQKAIMGKKKSK